MALTNAYTTLAEVKTRLDGISTSTHDSDLERSIEAASRAIDRYAGRRFWQDSTVADRYYRPRETDVVFTDDISTTTGLIVVSDDNDDGTYETTWTIETDFVLDPINASADGFPWTCITAIGTKAFPTGIKRRGVKVTAKFGWATTPTDIEEACIIQAVRLYKRADAPFGTAGSPEFGQLRLLARLDPDVEALVAPFRRVHALPVG